MFDRILIVCIGNVCRSPTAELLFREGLTGTGIEVSSAGVGALAGHPMDPSASALLTRGDHAIPTHVARQLTADMVLAADVVLVMDRRQIGAVAQLSPESRGKIFLLGKWQDDREIADPYRQDEAAFQTAYAQIREAVDAWVQRLRPR